MLNQVLALMYDHSAAEWAEETQIRVHSPRAMERALIVQCRVRRAVVYVGGEDSCIAPDSGGSCDCSSVVQSMRPILSTIFSAMPFALYSCLLECLTVASGCFASTSRKAFESYSPAPSHMSTLGRCAESNRAISLSKIRKFVFPLLQECVCEASFAHQKYRAILHAPNGGHGRHVDEIQTHVKRVRSSGGRCCGRAFDVSMLADLALPV
jgi:hypothetical protein